MISLPAEVLIQRAAGEHLPPAVIRNQRVGVVRADLMRCRVATRVGMEISTSRFSSNQSSRLTGDTANASQIATNSARSVAGSSRRG